MKTSTDRARATAEITTEVLGQTHEAIMFFTQRACQKAHLPPDDQLLMLAMVAACEADRALSGVVHVCDESKHSDDCAHLSGAMAASLAALLRNTLVPTLDKLFALADTFEAKENA